MTTHVLYLSPKVEIRYENDSYSIVAVEDLKIGERVLLESVIWSPKTEYIIASLLYDQELSKELHPRNTEDLGQKMILNMFKFNDIYVLGRVFSKFNHSCIPNCHMDCADIIEDTRVYGMWVHRKIKAGEELTIDYVNIGDVEYHNKMRKKHGFSCECTDDYIKMNAKRAQIHKDLGTTFRDRDRGYTAALVDSYLFSKEGKEHAKQKKKIQKMEKQVLIC